MIESPLSPTPTPTPKSSGHAAAWRAATIACLVVFAIVAATGMSLYEQLTAQIRHLQTKLQTTAQVKFIAVLLDDRGAPALLVTMDPQDKALQIQRLNSVVEGREDTMQIWALSSVSSTTSSSSATAGDKPRSMGILGSKVKTLRIPALEKDLVGITQLAVSVEDKGGVADAQGPRLPYLFQGAWVQKAL